MADATAGAGPLEAIIRQVPLFAGLSDEQIAQLCASSRRVTAAAGDVVLREGDAGDALLIILSGELEITKHDGGREITLATRKQGEILGEMSLLERWPRTASARANQDSELLEVDADAFRKVLEVNPAIATTILRTMAGRLRSTEASLMQREKLASLGTLAAGLAHELNNPAAAIQRSSSYLRDVLSAVGRSEAHLAAFQLTGGELQRLEALRPMLDARGTVAAGAAEEEDRLIARLEALGVPEPWEAGPPLAAAGWTVTAIDELAGAFAGPHRTAVLGWLAAQLGARQLVEEIQCSGRAISDIVRAVKSYAYLDQAAIQEVDLATTLDDTLMILKHRLSPGVEVVRDYQPGLPRVEVYAGELNQVWTNLVDNAIDAMARSGVIEIHTRQSGDGVEVRIADSGPGIPAEVASRIFEPFFTTKPQGVGTGLGLHIAHNIVVNRHHGRIGFDSRPGRTEFRVYLPRRLKRPTTIDAPTADPTSNE